MGRFYSRVIRSQFFSKHMPLDCELHKCFSVSSLPSIRWERISRVAWSYVFTSPTQRLEWAGIGCFPSPSGKMRADWSLVFSFPRSVRL